MLDLYNASCHQCSKIITNNYSTSFSLGIKLFQKDFREPIYAIYGFVRFADEIVDTFHQFDKKRLIEKFKIDTYEAIDHGISMNPILHSFQEVVNKYGVERELIEAFLYSMELDLSKKTFTQKEYEDYIYGSAEVIGLMCLKVFVIGDSDRYLSLRDSARSLGAAFQKVNFLRDIQSDYLDRGRVYFPNVDFNTFDCNQKQLIEADIEQDFDRAMEGIVDLPKGARLGVHLAYIYYKRLLKRIKKYRASDVVEQRIRVSDFHKLLLLVYCSFKHQLRLI